jgi:hypothetical protein
MQTLKQIPPFYKPKTDEHYPTRPRWSPGEPLQKDHKVDAWAALQRNAAAYEREQHRQRFTQPRRTHRGDRREA